MRLILKILVFSALILNSLPAQTNVEDKLMLYGRDRFYKVHLPKDYSYEKQYPLVIVFHGGLGNADQVEKQTGFSDKADNEGFIVVYPYGTGSFDKKLLTWNTWNCCGYADKKNIDDLTFVRMMINNLITTYNINPKMVYATGFSNGGMMCYLLACQLPGIFAAVAPVCATMFDFNSCDSNDEVSMVIFNSIDDKHIPYEGGIGESSLVNVVKLPVDDVIDYWKNKFKLRQLRKEENPSHQKIVLMNEGGTEINFYRMLKGGHSWPGSERVRKAADKPVTEISATDIIWEFFKRHQREK